MGRERRGTGRANPTPAQRIEVDLTRVCVHRGSVQLPYRLQGAFRQGPVAAVDVATGEPLELRFEPPRELLGLGPFFERHGLRANDALSLNLDSEGLEIDAVRRERRAPASSERPAAGSAPPPSRHRHAERGQDVRPDAPPALQREPASRSAAPSVPPTLRMEVPEPSVPETPGAEPARAAGPSGPTPRSVARWEPLDVTMGGGAGETPVPEGAWSGPEARVREVRRSRPSEASAASPKEPAARAQPDPGRLDPERTNPARPVATRGAGERQDEVADAPVQGRGLDLFGLRRRLGIGRAGTTRVVDSAAGPSAEPAGGPHAGPRAVPEAGPARPDRSPGGADAHRPAAQASLDFAADARRAGGGASDATAAPMAAPPSASAAPVATVTRAPADTREGTSAAAGGSLDADVAAVAAYLARPDIPAIVRAERVAETLEISVARADAALDRIAEDSERLGRIRAQAYMVRRRSQG